MTTSEHHPDGPPPPGLYDHLLSVALQHRLAHLPTPDLAMMAELDAEDSHAAVAQYLEHLIASSLSTLRGKEVAQRQRRLVDRIITALIDELGPDWSDRFNLADPLRRLIAIHAFGDDRTINRPDTPLARSALLTGTRLDPSLASQLNKEILAADRVDILCSFIKWSGLRLLLDSLRLLTQSAHPDGPRLRVISTSYMGATDARAIEELSRLPNTEVKVSYDTARTRLHAKAYLIHRGTGFGSAYVGSANVSRAALSDGLEWTTKISQYELPHLWRRLTATFETYWGDDEFEAYSSSNESRLRDAISRERNAADPNSQPWIGIECHPYPFQVEILDAIQAEREIQNKRQHLVVAATGTGKTMIAAFDYRRYSRAKHPRPPLLFVAHREEILKQALAAFRAVLRDQNFGDLLVGGTHPSQTEHLFCSIQAFNSRELWAMDRARYEYVVVDEFHHAAAPSYRRLLDWTQARVLLGLTATPERLDGRDVRDWFGGEATGEIRLPDAIQRRLLCPFHYFGVADCVDLDGLRWERGGYRVVDLDGVYTGNDLRAKLVLDKVHELLLDPMRARAIGFCVSIAHANFMARFFQDHGVPAIALSAESSSQERLAAKRRLIGREVNFIFVVDLYNEGIDIPEIDAVLFLRPTESLTVYLQQLGRGLRLHEEKDCLTVLDFIGAQNRQFRFASRFRAFSTDPAGRLDKEIEAGLPHLPAGCVVRLERVAQQRVLENVRQSVNLHRPRMVNDLRELGRHLGRPPAIHEALEYLDTSLPELLKRGLWSRLLADAKLAEPVQDPDEDQLAKGLRRLTHTDDSRQIRFLLDRLGRPDQTRQANPEQMRRLTMLHLSLWGADGATMDLSQAEGRLRRNPAATHDLSAVLRYNLAHSRAIPIDASTPMAKPLAIHCMYTRDEILGALGHWSMDRRPDFREGVLHLAQSRIDAFFVTLRKTEEAYSPTTMYEDYTISERLFHWQSQSTTGASSETGQRYVHHRRLGYTPLLFVREHRMLPGGRAAPYAFLGSAEYVSHEGSKPMSIVWRLQNPIPARLLRATSQSA